MRVLYKSAEMDLSGEDYEKVLKLMETTGEENFEQAVATLQRHNNDLDAAINSRIAPPSQQRQQPQDPQQDQAIVRRYVAHMQRKNQQWSLVSTILKTVVTLLSSVMNFVLSFLPQSIATKIAGTPFQKIYNGKLPTAYQHQPLDKLLQKTKNTSAKSVLLLVSPRRVNPDVVALFHNNELGRKIEQGFMMTCYVSGQSELAQVRALNDPPEVIVLRKNVFDEVVEVGRSRDIQRIDSQQLKRWAHQGRNLYKRDCNVLVKYRNYLARFYGYHYEEEQDEEVSLMQREMEVQEIRQQNEAYQRMEEETRKQREEQEVTSRRQQEVEEERRYRKMSIPDEPTEGDIVRISFRCPDGSTVFRNFPREEKLELVYQWVELNDDIEFEGEERNFELMYSYPPQSLAPKREVQLREVFESEQEKVMIRQL